jgi:ankyrin repeat protein
MRIKCFSFALMGLFFSITLCLCKTCPLIDAIKKADIVCVDQLIADGVDVNDQGSSFDDYSPLMIAARQGEIEIMEKLILAGANVNAQEGYDQPHVGTTVLYHAILSEKFEAVELLIDSGAEVNDYVSGNFAPMYLRCLSLLSVAIGLRVPIEIIELLIKREADVNQIGWVCYFTPLMVAAYVGYTQAVEALLDAGADKNIVNEKNNNKMALDYAKEQGYQEIVNLF